MPVLDIAHETLLRAFRVAARSPREMGRFNFGPRTLYALMARWKFPATLQAAIARPTPAGFSSSAAPATLTAPAQVKAVRDALIAEGTIAVAETDRTGKPLAWDFTPTTPFPSVDAYRAALDALFTPQDAPLSDAEKRKLEEANAHAMDWLDDGLTLPPEIDRLINAFERKLTPEEARRMIAWRNSVE